MADEYKIDFESHIISGTECANCMSVRARLTVGDSTWECESVTPIPYDLAHLHQSLKRIDGVTKLKCLRDLIADETVPQSVRRRMTADLMREELQANG